MKRKKLAPAQLRTLRAVARHENAGRCWWYYASRYQMKIFWKLYKRGYLKDDIRMIDGVYISKVYVSPKGWAQFFIH